MIKKILSHISALCFFVNAYAQNVGIGTITPTQKLEVNGTIKTNSLLMPTGASAGKILKTDANGIASWGSIDARGLFSTPPPAPDFSCPETRVSVLLGDYPVSIAVAGNYAYAVNEFGNNLQVINITNPEIPVLAGAITTGNQPVSVAVAGNYAYVLNYSGNSMQAFNISNPAVPVLVGSVAVGSSPTTLAVAGNYAYVGYEFSNSMRVYNISNPAAPVLMGSVATGFSNPLRSIAVAGSYAYVVGDNNRMQVINITNPSAPAVAGSLATGINPVCVTVAGNYAYVVCTGSFGMQVINIANPALPAVVGSVPTGAEPRSVAVSGNYAYVVDFNENSFQVINISNPATPVFVRSVGTGFSPKAVAILGNYAYVLNANSNNMQVISLPCTQNFSPIFNPATGQINTAQLPWNNSGSNINNSNKGNVGIGTIAPTAKLSVNGNANNFTGSWGVFSDARIKTITGDFTDGLNVINKISSKRFIYNRDAPYYSMEEQIGVVAQELEKVAPYMVTKNKTSHLDDLREVNNQAYTFLLINAIKELSKQNDVLKENAGKKKAAFEKHQKETNKQKAVYEARLRAVEDELTALMEMALTNKKE